ncbi:MAG: hypothetical protein AABY30_05405 [Candidatus Thermoplasmatota archaeon]
MGERRPLTLACYGDELARALARDVERALDARFPGELAVRTVGVEALEARLLAENVDVSVFPMDHLPFGLHEDLALAAVLPRRAPTDSLVSDFLLADLPRGVTVATSNIRRRSMLLRARPDLKIVETHEDVRERVQQWRVGDVDGVALGTSGLELLGIEAPHEELDPRVFVPSPGQGAIGCLCRKGSAFEEIARAVDDERTRVEVQVERGILRALEGGTIAPVGIRAFWRGTQLQVHAVILSLDGRRAVTLKEAIAAKDPLYEADELAHRLERMGGDVLLEHARRLLA